MAQQVVATGRALGLTSKMIAGNEVRKNVDLEKMLADDGRCADFMKELICVNDLKDAWSGFRMRLTVMEDRLQALLDTTSREVLERDFVMEDHFQRIVMKEHGVRLDEHGNRICSLQADADLASKTFGLHEQESSKHKSRLDSQERILSETVAKLEVVERQDKGHHKIVLELLRELRLDGDVRAAGVAEQFAESAARQTIEEQAREKLDETVKDTNDFLGSDRFQAHVDRMCRAMLEEYIPRSGAEAVFDELMIPMKKQFLAVSADLNKAKNDVALKHGATKKHFEIVDKKLQVQLVENGKIWRVVQERPTRADLAATEGGLQKGIQKGIEELEALAIGTSVKMQEVVHRVSDFQVILEDHEHALQHQAEEMLNRATKYDVIVNKKLIEQCASKEKVEAEKKDGDSQIKWLTAKVEELQLANSFGGISIGVSKTGGISRGISVGSEMTRGGVSGVSVASSSNAPAIEPQSPPSPLSPPSPPSLLTPISPNHATDPATSLPGRYLAMATQRDDSDQVSGPSATGESALIRQQLQGLAEVAMLLSHQQLRSQSGDRQLREAKATDTLLNMVNVLHWIQNRQAPTEFDAMRLKTLALKCAMDCRRKSFGSDDPLEAFPKASRKNTGDTLEGEDGGGSPQRNQASVSTRPNTSDTSTRPNTSDASTRPNTVDSQGQSPVSARYRQQASRHILGSLVTSGNLSMTLHDSASTAPPQAPPDSQATSSQRPQFKGSFSAKQPLSNKKTMRQGPVDVSSGKDDSSLLQLVTRQ